jgi:SET domain-containing protein
MSDMVVAESKIHGIGVFAARDFAPGETVLTLDDSRTVDEEHPLHPESGEYPYHCDYLAGGRVVLMPSPERHINSSCDPNTFVRTEDSVRRVVARRAIPAGAEITYDYLINCHGGEVWECRCGSLRCRRVMVSSFFELPEGLQVEYLPLLDKWFVAEHEPAVEELRRRAGVAGH